MQYQIRNIFIEKSCRKFTAKVSPRPFIILINNLKQPLHARNCFKVRYFERRLSKSLEKGNFIFFGTQSLSIDKIFQKQKGPGSSDQLLFRLRNKFRKIPLLVMYYQTKFDDII